MTSKKERTEAGATTLSEEELNEVQGGWSWGETNSVNQVKKKATGKIKTFDGKGNDQ